MAKYMAGSVSCRVLQISAGKKMAVWYPAFFTNILIPSSPA